MVECISAAVYTTGLSTELIANDLISKWARTGARAREPKQSRKTSITHSSVFKSDIVTLFKQKNAYAIFQHWSLLSLKRNSKHLTYNEKNYRTNE